MRDLVSDHGADPAEVDRIIGLRVEKRRLQNRRRKHDLVQTTGERVDQVRRRKPARPIDRPAQIREPLLEFPHIRAQPITRVVVARNGQTLVCLPAVRKTDLQHHRVELADRACLRRRAHPVEFFYARTQRSLDVL